MLGGARLLRSAGAGGGESASGDDALDFDGSSFWTPVCAVEADSPAVRFDNRPGREAVIGLSRGGGEAAELDGGRTWTDEVRPAGTLFGTAATVVRF